MGVVFKNFSTTTAVFELIAAGLYSLCALATWGGGSVQLQIIGPDGATPIDVGAALTANGFTTFDLPQGQYQIAVTTATGVYAALQLISRD
jgi:hypothetical protein